MTNNLPALNEEVSSKTVCDNLQTLHAAQKAFIAADNSNRIKKSLKTQWVHICSLVKINKVIFEEKSKKVILKELKNENDIKDTNVPDATERIVSVVKDIAEAQDENSEIPIEISSEA